MIDAACNYLNPYATASIAAATTHHTSNSASSTAASAPTAVNNFLTATSLYNNNHNNINHINSNIQMKSNGSNLVGGLSSPISCAHPNPISMKMEMQYPPQPSSTGSASPNSSVQSAPSSSVSPNIPSSPAQSFASISSSPPASLSATSAASPLSGTATASALSAGISVMGHGTADLGAAAASAPYSWSTYTGLPTRTQFPYAQYTSDYYGNVSMASSANAWFSHPDRLYPSWSSQGYPGFNFDEIAFQTQLQRRSVRCTCPNCTNEMSGLPPIVGPDERGRKQHICHIPGCERLYGKASHLKTHLRWHTGERPFLCLTCGKRFSRSDELQRHGRTHTNYRPYACPICSKKFSRSDHLSKHKKTHFKDKKSKKALAAEAKEQAAAAVKQEKAADIVHKKDTIVAASASNSTINSAASSIEASVKPRTQQPPQSSTNQQSSLKVEQPEIPSGYNPYSNLYHQSSALFHPHHLGAATNSYASSHQTSASLDLWHSNMQHQSQHQQQQHSNTTTNHSLHTQQVTHSMQQHSHPYSRTSIEQEQQRQQSQTANNNSATVITNNTTSVSNLTQQTQSQQQIQPTSTASALSSSQHYATLAMQSESQLAADYGLVMSAASPTGVNGAINSTPTLNHHMQHAAASSYSSLLGQVKSEYPSYSDFSTGAGYASSSAFHHHPHNPWATAVAYQHPHATA